MKVKILLLSGFAIILCMYGYAQPVLIRQHAFGGPGDNLFSDMKVTADRGLLLGGFTDAGKGLSKTEDSRGWRDYWLVKLDTSGKKQWDKTLGGHDEDDLTAFVQTRDHGYLVAGASESGISGDKTAPNRGGQGGLYDYWIIKLDSTGHKIWDKTIGGNFNDYLTSVDTTSDGGYILGGYSASPASGEKTQSYVGSSFNNDYWIVKTDAAGTIEWDKTLGGTGDDLLQDIKQTKDGGYIATGTSWSGKSGNKTEDNRGVNDFWVVKLDAAGNIQWDKTIGGSGVDFAREAVPTADGGYFIGGFSTSDISGEKTHNSKGGQDYWLVKLNNSGQVLWDRTIGGKLDDGLQSMQLTKDSGLVLCGSSYSGKSGDKTEPHRGLYRYADYWVVKLNKFGKKQWDKTVGGDNDDLGYAVCEYARNIYMIGGTSFSDVSYDRTVPLKGFADYWLVQLNYRKPVTSIFIADVTTSEELMQTTAGNNFSVYPNPVRNILYVQSTGKAGFTLLNPAGKTVLTTIITGSGQVNVSHLPAGMYYLHNNATHTSVKVVIVH